MSGFAGSSEFTRTYGSLSDADFVDRVYRNVLDRAPDAGGQAYWSGLLKDRRRSRGAVMLGFSQSSEFRRATAHRIDVTMVYEAMLRRAPSADAYAGWTDKLDAGTPVTDLVAAAFDGGEYRHRIAG